MAKTRKLPPGRKRGTMSRFSVVRNNARPFAGGFLVHAFADLLVLSKTGFFDVFFLQLMSLAGDDVRRRNHSAHRAVAARANLQYRIVDFLKYSKALPTVIATVVIMLSLGLKRVFVKRHSLSLNYSHRYDAGATIKKEVLFLNNSSNKTVLITGAAGALGQALVHGLTARDFDCIVLDRDLRGLNRLHDELAAQGRPPLIVPLDLAGAGPDDYVNLAEQLEQTLGRLDGLIHAAADFASLRPFDHVPPDEWIKTLQAGLTGPFLLSQCLFPLMAATPDSRMVWVNDDSAQVRNAYWGAYGVTQAGREALVDILSAECKKRDIAVHGIHPGPFYSPLRSRIWPAEHPEDLPTPEQAAENILGLFA